MYREPLLSARHPTQLSLLINVKLGPTVQRINPAPWQSNHAGNESLAVTLLGKTENPMKKSKTLNEHHEADLYYLYLQYT